MSGRVEFSKNEQQRPVLKNGSATLRRARFTSKSTGDHLRHEAKFLHVPRVFNTWLRGFGAHKSFIAAELPRRFD